MCLHLNSRNKVLSGFFFILLDVFISINRIDLVICSVAPFPLSFCLKGISIALTGNVYQHEQKQSY